MPFDWDSGFVVIHSSGEKHFDFFKIGGPGTKVTFFGTWFQFEGFCRVLAKIAHSYAYGLLGREGFEPCLVPFIHAKNGCTYDDCTFFIGNDPVPTEPEDSAVRIDLDETQGVDGQMWLCAGFGFWDTPERRHTLSSSASAAATSSLASSAADTPSL